MDNHKRTKIAVVIICIIFTFLLGGLLLFITDLTWRELYIFAIRLTGFLLLLTGLVVIYALVLNIRQSKE